ncbi:MAG: hypothetical protein WC212_02780 [Candidatus Delongbacteria bacterium]|jgi:hypothetical protein
MFKKVQIMLIIISAVCLTLSAAEKYAILIAGDYTAEGIAVEQQWNEGLGDNTEFWNDLYLQWEMLYKKDYKPENIKVLFAHGTDLWKVDGFQYIDPRYRAVNVTYDPTSTIVNYPATTTGLNSAISEIPSTSDDFLYVWVMSHSSSGSIYLMKDDLSGNVAVPFTTFANYFKPLNALNKVYWLNMNYAKNLEIQLQQDNAVIINSRKSLGTVTENK